MDEENQRILKRSEELAANYFQFLDKHIADVAYDPSRAIPKKTQKIKVPKSSPRNNEMVLPTLQ